MGGMDQVLRIMSPAQIRSIARAPQAKISLWEGSVSAGKTIASLFALLLAIRDAPRNGLIVIIGKTLATVHQNVFFNLQDPKIFGHWPTKSSTPEAPRPAGSWAARCW